jgi:hypothetical protein
MIKCRKWPGVYYFETKSEYTITEGEEVFCVYCEETDEEAIEADGLDYGQVNNYDDYDSCDEKEEEQNDPSVRPEELSQLCE